MKAKKVGFIGGGRIASILLQGFEKCGTTFDQVSILDPNNETLQALKTKFPLIQIADEVENIAKCDYVFLAVHPPMVLETLTKLNGKLGESSILISLAPKITMEKMTTALGGFSNIVRMNPSASTIVNKGVNPVTFSKSLSAEQKSTFLSMVSPLGYTPEVLEEKIEAYAMISAMGHTYFFFQLNKLKELAVNFGMESSEAEKALTNMLWGTTETMFNAGLSYQEVSDLVPIKPLMDVEQTIIDFYDEKLSTLFNKIKP